jgi:hypothetical protein
MTMIIYPLSQPNYLFPNLYISPNPYPLNVYDLCMELMKLFLPQIIDYGSIKAQIPKEGLFVLYSFLIQQWRYFDSEKKNIFVLYISTSFYQHILIV